MVICSVPESAVLPSTLLYPPQNGVLLYPLQNGVLGGYTVFSMSVSPWFRDSMIARFCQHLRFLLYNFDSFCPILFNSTPHLNH